MNKTHRKQNWPVQNVSFCICMYMYFYMLSVYVYIFPIHFHMEKLPCLSGLSALCLRNKEAHEA